MPHFQIVPAGKTAYPKSVIGKWHVLLGHFEEIKISLMY